MTVALAAIGGALLALAITGSPPVSYGWPVGLLLLAISIRMDERDRRPQGRYIDHRKGWR